VLDVVKLVHVWAGRLMQKINKTNRKNVDFMAV
jgi:hypothetical protein